MNGRLSLEHERPKQAPLSRPTLGTKGDKAATVDDREAMAQKTGHIDLPLHEDEPTHWNHRKTTPLPAKSAKWTPHRVDAQSLSCKQHRQRCHRHALEEENQLKIGKVSTSKIKMEIVIVSLWQTGTTQNENRNDRSAKIPTHLPGQQRPKRRTTTSKPTTTTTTTKN
ncbi:expressed unknown protein [Seminavis robusta]|uniref:Uncharacterized protein n=1 Tax=Seminavis robusta TaxID=568900 RepID=A0A9N8EAF6_9STRA|nr:expressed unknown protein [Seminavis robusta]|eukprot:Sro808_g205340.1 n/a (168) ;mRNA; f:4761-5357